MDAGMRRYSRLMTCCCKDFMVLLAWAPGKKYGRLKLLAPEAVAKLNALRACCVAGLVGRLIEGR
jgi:hypothetical protein